MRPPDETRGDAVSTLLEILLAAAIARFLATRVAAPIAVSTLLEILQARLKLENLANELKFQPFLRFYKP